MSRRENFVLKIWRKLHRRWFRKEPVRLQSASASPPPIRKEVPGIEPLEGRIAPATVVLTFLDSGGDPRAGEAGTVDLGMIMPVDSPDLFSNS